MRTLLNPQHEIAGYAARLGDASSVCASRFLVTYTANGDTLRREINPAGDLYAAVAEGLSTLAEKGEVPTEFIILATHRVRRDERVTPGDFEFDWETQIIVEHIHEDGCDRSVAVRHISDDGTIVWGELEPIRVPG